MKFYFIIICTSLFIHTLGEKNTAECGYKKNCMWWPTDLVFRQAGCLEDKEAQKVDKLGGLATKDGQLLPQPPQHIQQALLLTGRRVPETHLILKLSASLAIEFLKQTSY